MTGLRCPTCISTLKVPVVLILSESPGRSTNRICLGSRDMNWPAKSSFRYPLMWDTTASAETELSMGRLAEGGMALEACATRGDNLFLGVTTDESTNRRVILMS